LSDEVQKVRMEVKKEIPGPVFFFLKYQNFYQNHRIMTEGYSISQLKNLEGS